MDSRRDHEEPDPSPWLLSTHLQGAHAGPFALSQQLWFKPHQLGDDDEDEEDAVTVTHERWEDPEQDLIANNSCFQRTISRTTPTDTCPSARTFQTTRLSAQDYSRHSMNIKSQTCEYYLSRKPLLLPEARSLTKWIPTVDSLHYPARSTSLGSPKTGRGRGLLKILTGRNGTPQMRTNSGSSGKEMAVLARK
nr:P4-MP [Wild carrot red leaf virus]